MSAPTPAAKMAGNWWASLLHERYADKREAFAAAVAVRVDQELRGDCYWDWWGKRQEGQSRPDTAEIEFDYDPHYLLVEVFEEVIGGCPWEWKDAMPIKHHLWVHSDRLRPKAGYGEWVRDIPVIAGGSMSEKPEALRLADYIERNNANDVWKGTATELRRLHIVNAGLLRALQQINDYAKKDGDIIAQYFARIARDAIAKATGGEE
jgi:hypothetical protein